MTKFLEKLIEKQYLLKLVGQAGTYHCEVCGSNVFHKENENSDVYICNGCGEEYIGEKEIINE